MKALVQRVSEASVTVDGKVIGQIDQGLLILLGISPEDDQKDEAWLLNKVVNMRVFNDHKGVMNLSVLDVGGEILVISQFTLMANTKKGHRPSYIGAAKPEHDPTTHRAFSELVTYTICDMPAEGIFCVAIVAGIMGSPFIAMCHNQGS